MKKLLFLSLVCIGLIANASAGKKCKKKKCKKSCEPTVQVLELKNEIDSVNYAIGILMGEQLKQMELDTLRKDLVNKGIDGAFKGDSTMNAQQASELLNFYFLSKDGIAFLAENATKPNVKITESGLQYLVVKEGEGPKPTAANNVTVHYKGTLIDGTVFDSSYDRGEPATFGLGQVIQGWIEGLQLMSVGSKYTFYIPYELAYGTRGGGETIPPYAALIFEVELISIN